MHVSATVAVSRGPLAPAAAQVLEQVRRAGAVRRDELVTATRLSPATVGRAVAQLVDAGLLRECLPKRRRPGVGRPGIPVEVDPDAYVTIGVHVGRRITTVALGDVAGHVVASDTVRRAVGADPDLTAASQRAAALLAALPGRVPLSAGVVGPWRDLGLSPEQVGAELHELTGLPVRAGDHVAAVAATEFLHRRQGAPGTTLYVYARDTIGFAVALDAGAQAEVSQVGSLGHFPSGSDVACWCGRTGCLEVTAGDDAVIRAARDAGLLGVARANRGVGPIGDLYSRVGEPAVLALVRRRARILGRVAASVRDIVAPDRVVLVGQAFTGCPPVLGDITEAMAEAGLLDEVPVSFTRFGSGIQAVAACTIALGPIYDDPLGVVSGVR
ncbi:ROK family transcriptional regulator [Nocardioides sp.]|uniref:ROK family transcriptional regulator n=1 Tax=Nocardioides sp. TaxID=35761 RepID=UPI0025E6A8E6|nr:ROK family transcriptional regulator [Nocardioides sp.]